MEALLTADADNDDFLSSPAYEFVAGMLADEPSEFLAGQKLGRFEILCSLGSGGMGQIYLAHDENLDRKIALKLISRDFAADPQRVNRFEQEARAASALNHPNVCVIHDVGKTETGRHFIAMEFIQGITLRDQLGRGTFKTREALQVALQVGAALASAHAIGIVHRDIKPENIMLRPDGYVKVVDFGLAKLMEVLPERRRLGKANAQVLTEPRMLMGTVKYMSPEQLREESVDERTDIWSLGIVLYEMLTGSTPFEARSRNDSIALILASEPVQLDFSDAVPPKLREIITKALEKDCEKRYQTVLKLTADLTGLKKELELNAEGYSASVTVVQPSPEPYAGSRVFTRLKSQTISIADSLFNEIRTHKTATAIFTAASGVLAFLLFLPAAARWISIAVDPVSPPQQVEKIPLAWTMKQLTTTGTSVAAALSPDGNLVAHVEEQKGKQRLVVSSTTAPDSSIAVPPKDSVKYLGITFSRDGSYLYFTRTENNDPGNLYRLAWPGNTPEQIKKGVDSPISLSPEGDRFAFVRHDRGNAYFLMLANIDGTNEKVIATRTGGDTLSVYGLAWSPDGRTVVCPESRWNPKFHTNLVAFDVNDKHEEVIRGPSWFKISDVDWQDASTLIVNASEYNNSPFRLWRVQLRDGTTQQITSDIDDYQGVSTSGGKIVTIKTNLSWNLWISAPGDQQQATQITSGGGLYYGLAWTSRGRIIYSSMAQDRLNIFGISPDGSDPVQLTTNAGDNYTPAVSADGQYVLFTSDRNNGYFNIWRMNVEDGGDPVQLTFGDGNFYPSCSSNNEWVVFDNQTNTRMSIWRVPLQGGDAVKLSDGYRMPVFSPDSQLIACRYDEDSDTYDVAILPAQGGQPLRHFKIPKQEWQSVRWLGDNRQVTFVRNVNGASNIWSYNLDTGAEKQLTNFNSEQIYAYAWSPDYKQIACQRGTQISDVTIISER
ncbi:MAG TPA: protein kinase [Pyrinomonadaceae bacterium]|nr:protein kinase [Pyrinomonadaceae bacterium]